MNSIEMEKFECFLDKCFREGNMFRELRLSEREIKYLSNKYPLANLKKIEADDSSDDKVWYEVSFSR